MSRKIAEELLPRLRQRYTGLSRQGRSRLIDELCEQWGYSRKHAIKLLGAKTGWGGDPRVRKGRPPKYDSKVEGVARDAASSASFQSSYGLLALRTRCRQKHPRSDFMTSESTIHQLRTLSGVIYF
jgi:hypothetical protein